MTALIISISVLSEGFAHLKTAVLDLMDRHPVHSDNHEKDELIDEIEQYIHSWEWVSQGKVRFREHGPVYFGEIFLVPKPSVDLLKEVEEGSLKLREHNWKLYDIVITPVSALPED